MHGPVTGGLAAFGCLTAASVCDSLPLFGYAYRLIALSQFTSSTIHLLAELLT